MYRNSNSNSSESSYDLRVFFPSPIRLRVIGKNWSEQIKWIYPVMKMMRRYWDNYAHVHNSSITGAGQFNHEIWCLHVNHETQRFSSNDKFHSQGTNAAFLTAAPPPNRTNRSFSRWTEPETHKQQLVHFDLGNASYHIP